jgi:molybdenum cofactor cytidylyltransferase
MSVRPASRIGCIVLAAGRSIRFGSDKRLADFHGEPLLLHVLEHIPDVFSSLTVVLAPGDEALAEHIPRDWQIVFARSAKAGMGFSVAEGLVTATDWDGAVIALADMPWIRQETWQAIRDAVEPDNLVVPVYQGSRGNPAGIGRQFFNRLMEARGDYGARELFKSEAGKLRKLEVDDPGILRDIDIPADLA